MGGLEIAQALVSPVDKLVEAFSSAIGKAYEPHHIKKMADAKAYELETISNAVRNNSDVPIVYDSTGVSIDTSDFEEIAKRASNRLAYQEISKQQNIEAVIDNAYENLQGADPIQDKPIDPDWMSRFFNSVENIGNEDMQKIWGRILAGEIQSPNKYSYRTIEKLRNISQSEALLFQRIASLSLRHENTFFILGDTSLMNKHGIFFTNLLTLEECGVMSSQTLTLTLSVSNAESNIIYNSKILGRIGGKTENEEKITLSIHVFTEAGVQLMETILPERNEAYIIDCMEFIRDQYKEQAIVTAHRIDSFTGEGKINYCSTDILPELKSD